MAGYIALSSLAHARAAVQAAESAQAINSIVDRAKKKKKHLTQQQFGLFLVAWPVLQTSLFTDTCCPFRRLLSSPLSTLFFVKKCISRHFFWPHFLSRLIPQTCFGPCPFPLKASRRKTLRGAVRAMSPLCAPWSGSSAPPSRPPPGGPRQPWTRRAPLLPAGKKEGEVNGRRGSAATASSVYDLAYSSFYEKWLTVVYTTWPSFDEKWLTVVYTTWPSFGKNG